MERKCHCCSHKVVDLISMAISNGKKNLAVTSLRVGGLVKGST